MNIVGLPNHLWPAANAKTLVKEVGVVVVKMDRECLDFSNMKIFIVKTRLGGPVESWDYLVVSDEEKDYTVVVQPTINQDDLSWDAQHELGSNLGWVFINPLRTEEQEVEEG